MSLKLLKKLGFFCLTVVKPTILLLFCFAYLIGVSAQVSDKSSANNSTCESARLASGQGNYEEASNLIKSCLEHGSETNAQAHAENLLLASEIDFSLGKDVQAAEYATLAENHYISLGEKKQKDYWWFGVKLKKIRADLEIEAGNYESAAKIYKEGLAILASTNAAIKIEGGEPRRLKANLLSGISFIELKTGLYSEAVKHLESALAELDNSPLDNYCRAGILNDFGHLLNEQRSHRRAVEYLEQSAKIWQHEKEWFNFAITQQNLAIAFRGMGDYKQSQTFFERVRDLAVKNDFDGLETMSLQGLASIYQIRGEHQPAIVILQKALGQTSGSVRRAEILWRLSASQNQLGENAVARTNAKECFEWATAQKIENLRYLCATDLGESYLKDSPATAEKWFNTAIEITESLSRKVAGREAEKVYFMQDKAAAYHRLIKLFVEANKPEQALAVSEKLKSRVLREKLQSRTSKILGDDISNQNLNIPADTVIVSYVLTDNECFAFILESDRQPKVIRLPAGKSDLSQQIGRYRESILNFSPTFKTEARQLYDLLLKPSESDIAKTKRLIIVPDGALWELPFQALINSSGKYVVEEREILYAPYLGILSELKSSQTIVKEKKFIAFANSTRKDSASLPEAEREIIGISKLYSSQAVFVKRDATESRVKTESEKAGILHLAVHGEMSQSNPFDSGLLFTESAGDDGRLTVAEILQLNLPDSLVVLSSCDTSSGHVIDGEGLLSLSWAFLASGGRNVIAAQWAVEEKATADLMLNFHRTLKSLSDKPAYALQATQIEALKRPIPFNHPFYWAGFVSVGGGPHR